MVMRRLHVPHIIGMILAGVLIGPYATNVLERDSSFEIFGQVGLYYIMFLAALEMDTRALVKNVGKYLLFGLATFAFPFILAYLASISYFGYTPQQSVILATILSSNTLIAYPIISRYGIARNKSVSLSVGGSMISLLLSLVVVAGVATSFDDGNVLMSWAVFSLKILGFGLVMILFVPRFTRVFLRYYSDSVTQFIYVLGIMFLAAAFAQWCGIEGVLGAFVAGLIINRFVPHVSPLMNRIEFVGNALFIPYFLIGVGMMININALFSGVVTLIMVAILVVVGTFGKALAAYFTSWILKLNRNSGTMMFGLTSAHAAGAIAIIMVGIRLEIAPGKYLLDDDLLNAIVMMILITCIISSVITEYVARRVVLEKKDSMIENDGADDEKILLPIKDEESAVPIVNIAAMMCNHHLNRGLIALNVIYDDDDSMRQQRKGREMLQHIVKQAAAMDVRVQTQSRLASNVTNGIVHAFKEYDASELIVGCNGLKNERQNTLGNTLDSLISQLNHQIIITHLQHPLNTIRMIDVVVPQKAEYEPGFYRWIERLVRVAENLSCRITFYAGSISRELIANYINKHHSNVVVIMKEFEMGDGLMSLRQQIPEDHLLVLIVARRGTVSYSSRFEKLKQIIDNSYSNHSLLIVFPDQYGMPIDEITFTAPQQQDDKSGWAIFRRFFTKKK